MNQDEVLSQMMIKVGDCVTSKGWREPQDGVNRSFTEDLMLMVSECSEVLEAFRDYGMDGPLYEYKDHGGGLRFIDREPVVEGVQGKPIHVGSEMADILIRLLDTCDRFGIDISTEFDKKMEYNWSRPYRHGNKLL